MNPPTCPHDGAVGRTFTLTIPLPEPSNAGGRPHAKEKKSRKENRKPTISKPCKKPTPKRHPEPTPAEVEARKENRHEYDRNRNNTPERRELHRHQTQAKRNEAKALGLCVDCWALTIPDRTRCETCAEQHRAQRRQAKKRASQQRNQDSGQTTFL